MSGDLEIGQLQANMKNVADSISDIKQYLGKGIERHTEVMSKLAVISNKQDNMQLEFKDYKIECTKERDDHEDRITTVENYQGTQKKTMAFIAATAALFITVGGKFLEKLAALFS